MNITVKLTGLHAGAAGFKEKTMEISNGLTAGDVFTMLALPMNAQWTRISINNKIAAKNQKLQDSDTVLFFPAGGGG
jgi:molybdopterin converting factor small subunit